MISSKKQIRAEFRRQVFSRDRNTCRLCGCVSDKPQEEMDAHHIRPRKEFECGGYFADNGITLCKFGNPSCHEKAESHFTDKYGAPVPEASPEILLELIKE